MVQELKESEKTSCLEYGELKRQNDIYRDSKTKADEALNYSIKKQIDLQDEIKELKDGIIKLVKKL